MLVDITVQASTQSSTLLHVVHAYCAGAEVCILIGIAIIAMILRFELDDDVILAIFIGFYVRLAAEIFVGCHKIG